MIVLMYHEFSLNFHNQLARKKKGISFQFQKKKLMKE